MKAFKNFTLKEFSDVLSQKTPVPGGGAVAALCAANAAGLVSMVARYALGRKNPKRIDTQIKNILQKSERLRKQFLDLADKDAKAYLKVVAARKKTPGQKRSAKRQAAAVPKEVAKLCRQMLDLMPGLVKHGSPYLLSDVEVAVEMLFAAYKSAMINIKVNSK